MSEMKIGSTDPKVIATVIIVNWGQTVQHGEVLDVVWDALGHDSQYRDVKKIADEVWDLIQDATVTVTWDDDDDDEVVESLICTDCPLD